MHDASTNECTPHERTDGGSSGPVCHRCGGEAVRTPFDCNSKLALVDTVCPVCNIGWHEPGFNRGPWVVAPEHVANVA